MQSKIKQIVIIALVAIIGFSFISCDKNKGGITTHFKFDKGSPPASLNMSVARFVTRPEGTTVDSSYAPLNAYYGTLGAKVRGITPTEFVIGLNSIITITDGEEWVLADYSHEQNGMQYANFANSITLTTTDELEAGSTTTAIQFRLQYFSGSNAKISFIIPSELNAAHWLKTAAVNPNMEHPPAPASPQVIARSDNSVTVTPHNLMPSPSSNPFGPDIFYYNGTVYRCATITNPINPSTIGITGYPHNLDNHVIIPMKPLVISADASSMTATVNWFLTDIIEQYQGADNTSDTADDVFILSKDFWERLSISFTIN